MIEDTNSPSIGKIKYAAFKNDPFRRKQVLKSDNKVQKTKKMGFSSALQGPASHDAILLRIDAELRLLENMRRCVGIRIKSDSKCLQHPGGLSLRNLGKISKKWNNNKCFFIFK